ncbi:MAG TPA: PAS sensor protein [Candidatus Coprenecus pullistercoris]|nr:PAS sensor protein [Candidatus Coprenecus pullistercoris]
METIEDFFKGTGCAVTVCDTECNIVYQNDRSVAVNGDMRGRNMMPCHNERSQSIIRSILTEGISNSYTISKKGQRKLIHQTPWLHDGRIAGIIELSIVIPEQMPHYNRG